MNELFYSAIIYLGHSNKIDQSDYKTQTMNSN